jgi:hypothetical protein
MFHLSVCACLPLAQLPVQQKDKQDQGIHNTRYQLYRNTPDLLEFLHIAATLPRNHAQRITTHSYNPLRLGDGIVKRGVLKTHSPQIGFHFDSNLQQLIALLFCISQPLFEFTVIAVVFGIVRLLPLLLVF